ncbi:hypothetical protein PG301_13850 [Parageobacillus sp. G301]|nr:hypothetical protein PG301_13850 [Parageobacillus sp. G301]
MSGVEKEVKETALNITEKLGMRWLLRALKMLMLLLKVEESILIL